MGTSEPFRSLPTSPPLPRWFWSLPLLALALWWPIASFWASDDFFALHYAQDPTRALADFTHWQYGAQDLWFFWRPLITLSFCWDAWLAGGDPLLAHAENALAHGLSTLLVGLLWRRLLPDGRAFTAALLWALLPGHAGTIAWAVGRVDGHTTVWILLSLWTFVRWGEGRNRSRALSLVALMLALASKELAFAVPLLCTVLGCALRRGWSAAWPHWLLLAAALAFRIGVLGRFGGYTGTHWDPIAMATGFLTYVANLLNPWRWQDPAVVDAAIGALGRALPWLGWLPALLAAWHCLRPRRLGPTALALTLFVAASAPVAGFFAGADNPHNLRYFYLASGALCGLLVAGGRAAGLAALLTFAPAFVLMRLDQHHADTESAQMHRELVRQTEGQPGLWFAAGLPHGNRTGTVVQLHFGIDRMLRPPFADRQAVLYAHRPFYDVPGAVRLHDDEDMPIAVPGARTVLFRGADLLVTVPERPLPELPIAVEWRVAARDNAPAGPWQDATANGLDLSSPRMQSLKDGADPELGGIAARLRSDGVRPQAYRVTVFTANGYACAVLPADAQGESFGSLDLLRLFATAQGAPGAYLLRLLEAATIVDLDPSFPVLVEGGVLRGDRFLPTHRARSLVRFAFDRGYPAVVRRMLGIER